MRPAPLPSPPLPQPLSHPSGCAVREHACVSVVSAPAHSLALTLPSILRPPLLLRPRPPPAPELPPVVSESSDEYESSPSESEARLMSVCVPVSPPLSRTKFFFFFFSGSSSSPSSSSSSSSSSSGECVKCGWCQEGENQCPCTFRFVFVRNYQC